MKPQQGSGPVPLLTWSAVLGKRVRDGDWSDQAVATSRKINAAIEARKWEQAAQLIDYWMEEAKVLHNIYGIWFGGFVEWLSNEGVPQSEIDSEIQRLRNQLRFPGGTPFDASGRWIELAGLAGVLANRIRVIDLSVEDALGEFDRLRELWRQAQDRWADLTSGILALVAKRFGEAALGDCYRFVLDPYLRERYQPFDLRDQPYESTLYRNLYTAFESMRGHLCGPDRMGDIDLEETEDSWVLQFDPCGSGGRSQRGDPVEGTGSRVLAPYEFGVTQELHDWAWNERGVCYYCAHCCFALELWPAEQWGHPVRIIDSPLYPSETQGQSPAKCKWTIYKSLEAIPESAYQRIGRTKPPIGEGTFPGSVSG